MKKIQHNINYLVGYSPINRSTHVSHGNRGNKYIGSYAGPGPIKALNIIVNDNKNLIPLFEGRFNQFVLRHKGTDLNSPEAIIKLLNSRSRSFLKVLESLVIPFKNIDRNITNYCNPHQPLAASSLREQATMVRGKGVVGGSAWKSTTSSPHLKGAAKKVLGVKKVHPKRLASLTKDIRGRSPLLSIGNNSLQGNSTVDVGSVNSVTPLYLNGTAAGGKVNTDILTQKIDSLTQSLNNNKLSIPFNLLKPLAATPSIRISPSIAGVAVACETGVSGGANSTNLLSNDSQSNNLTTIPYLAALMSGKMNGLPAIRANKLGHQTSWQSIRKSKYLGMFMPFSSINPYQQYINAPTNFNAGPSNNTKIQNLFGLLEYAFIAMSCLISKPVYSETPDKININLFYYLVASDSNLKQGAMNKVTAPIAKSYNGIEIKNVTQPSEYASRAGINNIGPGLKKTAPTKGSISGLVANNSMKLFTQSNMQKLNLLCLILSRIFKKPVELDLIRLHLPYFDDNILVKAIGIMSKDVNVRNIFNIIFTKTKIATLFKNPLNSAVSRTGGVNSYLAGIKIRIGGRLMTQRVIPRLSTRVTQKGAITRGKIKYINSSRVNLKNKRGAHSITVTMSHLI